MKIAFQGERGAFSELAARQLVSGRIDFVPCERFEAVFQALAAKKVDAAVIPIENTLHGSVHENYDHLLHFGFPITAETNVRIVHHLIAAPGVKFSALRKVYSHPVALNQCLDFFAVNPQLAKTTYYDTAGSVKMVMQERPRDAAAIASSLAAEVYGAHILKRGIEDDRQNFTRFFLLKRSAPRARADSGHWKTSVAFTTRNIPGALFRALSALALRDINLTKIESRPMRGKPWEYQFYLDFLGHVDELRVKNALRHLEELADFLRVMGCYRPATR